MKNSNLICTSGSKDKPAKGEEAAVSPLTEQTRADLDPGSLIGKHIEVEGQGVCQVSGFKKSKVFGGSPHILDFSFTVGSSVSVETLRFLAIAVVGNRTHASFIFVYREESRRRRCFFVATRERTCSAAPAIIGTRAHRIQFCS